MVYKIIRKEVLAPTMKLIEVEAPEIAVKVLPGNFIIFRIDEKGERVPLTVADFDRQKGTITLIFQEVGYTTKHLGRLEVGDQLLDLVGPLGEHLPVEGYKKVICVGGGSGTALLYPKAKAFYEAGTEVLTITGARTEELLFLLDELRAVSSQLFVTTDDGSYGHHGFVTDVLQNLLEEHSDVEEVVAIGPVPMMKACAELTKKYGVRCIVSLNSIMVDGTGMCGGCRVTVGGETKFTCVDGPAFDGHLVDFDDLMRRLVYYREHESQTGEHECCQGRGGDCQCQ